MAVNFSGVFLGRLPDRFASARSLGTQSASSPSIADQFAHSSSSIPSQMGQHYAHSHHPSSMEGRQSQVTHERTSQSTPRSLGRSRTASTDLAFHPYKPAGRPAASSASSTPVPSTLMPQNITFVDTTQQASGFVDPLQQCRPKRKRISPEQLLRLTAVFDQTDSPSYDMRDQLGAVRLLSFPPFLLFSFDRVVLKLTAFTVRRRSG